MTSPSRPLTPAMQQYQEAKRQYPDALLLFRMGDFYELFYEDALVASRALDLTLTARQKDSAGGGIPMCGVPYHAIDGYMMRLVKLGHRVAICDQVEDPKQAKGIVKREVVRVVSPGTFTDAGYLDAREPIFLAALAPLAIETRATEGRRLLGLATLEPSTGEFTVTELEGDRAVEALGEELRLLRARELLVPAGSDVERLLVDVDRDGLRITAVEPSAFNLDTATRVLLDQLQVAGLQGFGLDGHTAAIAAAGALVHYLRDTQKVDLVHVRGLSWREKRDALIVDNTTLSHLEVVRAIDGSREGSLLHVLDDTTTAMGARRLRAWLLRPLVDVAQVHARLDAVEDLAFRAVERGKLRETLGSVHDMERLVARIALRTAGPRDLVGLRQSLAAVPRVRRIIEALQSPLICELAQGLDELADVRDRIAHTLVDDPPALARDGGLVRDGADGEVDELRGISRSGKQGIAGLEAAERQRTGIQSLKVRFNRVFGYYIEVSKANLHAVPPDYQRKQTIAGGERFITPALKEQEERVLGADERLLVREVEMFDALRQAVALEAPRIQRTATSLAALDVLAAFAEVAARHNYTKPQVHDGDELEIVDGRHPVVERLSREAFVPNDTRLDNTAAQLSILTGPNMGGKSTYLRQVALTCLMAQAGSFVPARQAKLSIVDRIYARVGASDNIARGQSTFMAEMQETASILNTATARSLVVLDEIGRGTATFDGLSIAWAVAEYLATNARARPKTLFATHYHELTDLADALPSVVNAHFTVREWKDQIVFLRKVVPGRSDRSYGIQVARLAGLPRPVIARAREILSGLEQDELQRGGRPSLTGMPRGHDARQQLGLFQTLGPDDKLAERLRSIEIDQMTPLEALALLAELKADLE
ncbi:MAG: DNA mismatch repair protein MutS [Luteitalea sp.]|nr:DNA mismatch repair protein MutS [Luteitalea sp.]